MAGSANIRDFSNDLGNAAAMGGVMIHGGGDQSMSYVGNELIDLLRSQRNNAGVKPTHMISSNEDTRNPMLDQAAYSFNRMIGEPSSQNGHSSQARKPSGEDQPALYIKIKEENEHLKQRVDALELELAEETKKVGETERRNLRLHSKLEQKDKSISKLRDNLKQLKDDIAIVNENIAQAKSSALFIKAEDEHLKEMASEMVILLDDCFKKTVVKEDEKGNMTIGALNFHDEELVLIN